MAPPAGPPASCGLAPVAGLDVGLRLAGVEAELRRLDALARATPGIRTLARSLLATESLSGRQLAALVAGERVPREPGTGRRVERFELALDDGRRARALDADLLGRLHRRIVPGGGELRTGGPVAADPERLLGDLGAFLDRDDVCPVVQAAIGYAQLDAVQPFTAGNGRLGRLLVQVVLRRRAVATALVPPVGPSVAARPATVLAARAAYAEGDVETWCTFAGDALASAAAAAVTMLRDGSPDRTHPDAGPVSKRGGGV